MIAQNSNLNTRIVREHGQKMPGATEDLCVKMSGCQNKRAENETTGKVLGPGGQCAVIVCPTQTRYLVRYSRLGPDWARFVLLSRELNNYTKG